LRLARRDLQRLRSTRIVLFRHTIREHSGRKEGGNRKLSARNQLQGTIKEVHKGTTTARVEIEVGGTVLTASITDEAVDELKLTKGQKAYAVIKASDVMIGTE